MLYHAGASSLLSFLCRMFKKSRIVIYRSKVIRLKCSLNRSYINYGELHCDSVNSSLVFFFIDSVSLLTGARSSLECFVISTLWSKRVLRADRKADVNQTCQQSVFSPIITCIRIWCTVVALERRSQMFVYRPFRFSFSLVPRSTKGLFTG